MLSYCNPPHTSTTEYLNKCTRCYNLKKMQNIKTSFFQKRSPVKYRVLTYEDRTQNYGLRSNTIYLLIYYIKYDQ